MTSNEDTEYAGAAFVLGLNLGLTMSQATPDDCEDEEECQYDDETGECDRDDCPVG